MKKLHYLWLIAAAQLVLSSCGINTMPSHDEWYTKHYYIMQDFERQTYKELSPAARLEFQTAFWEARDPKSKKVFDKRMTLRDEDVQEGQLQPAVELRPGPHLPSQWSAEQRRGQQNANWAMGASRSRRRHLHQRRRPHQRRYLRQHVRALDIPVDIYLVSYVFTFRSPNEWRYSSGTGTLPRRPGRVEQGEYLRSSQPIRL